MDINLRVEIFFLSLLIFFFRLLTKHLILLFQLLLQETHSIWKKIRNIVKDLIQELSLRFGLDENSEVRSSSATGIQSFVAGLLL